MVLSRHILLLFETSVFDTELGEPAQEIDLIYPADTLEGRFEALASDMVMIMQNNY